MDLYEAALQKAADEGYKVIENCNFEIDAKGLIIGNKIGLSSKLQTTAEKRCVLAEEMAHAKLSSTDITDSSKWKSRHEELKARRTSHDELVGITGLIAACKAGCNSLQEAADFLNVTTEFLAAAITSYRERYGNYITTQNYIITLCPIGVMNRF